MIGMDGNENDAQFRRNLRVLSTVTSSNDDGSLVPNNQLLVSFVRDLSFWEASSLPPYPEEMRSAPNHQSWVSKWKNHVRLGNPLRAHQNQKQQQQRSREKKKDHRKSEIYREPIWKSALDKASGKVYYYDVVTRKTQWEKPEAIIAMERRQAKKQQERDRRFFKEMECNLLASLGRGELIPRNKNQQQQQQQQRKEEAASTSCIAKPNTIRVRTISGMGDKLLTELRDDGNATLARPMPLEMRTSSSSSSSSATLLGKPPLPTRPYSNSRTPEPNMDLSPDDIQVLKKEVKGTLRRVDSGSLVGENLLDGPLNGDDADIPELGGKQSPPNGHIRRNTGGTIYLKNTMMNPDIQATIKCVCGVYRAHIALAATVPDDRPPPISPDKKRSFGVFLDLGCDINEDGVTSVPSLADVVEFYGAFYKRSRMEHDTIITSLIYVERLVKATNGELVPSPDNWRSILFACMVMASKVWDDLSMWNVDFSNVSANTSGLASFSLKRINELELAVLNHLHFDVRVPASEYAKYYFLIRNMLIRSSLVNEGEAPLRKQDAFQKLENLTQKYQDSRLRSQPIDRRTKSMDDCLVKILAAEKECKNTVLNDQVCLEQLIG